MTTVPPLRQAGFTGRHMLLLVGAFFGVVITVNVGMAVMAARSWTGLVVPNSYVASQQFEGKRLAHERQRAAGWQATLAVSPGLVRLMILDAAGRPVDLGRVSLALNRPVGGHDDRAVELSRTPDGAYVAPLDLAPGTWEARVSAPGTPLGPFELHERFRLEGTAP
jgi:nitrogen fixation protein FixH